jgi:endonuclease/exonuclease/phosphatase family metal-dependent hydrolase
LGLEPKIIKRGALIGTFIFEQKKIRITNIHLDFQGGNAHRVNQLKYLVDYLASEAPEKHEIICGDFNTLGIFYKKEKILSLEKQIGNTFRSILPKPYTSAVVQQLDYIFIKNLAVHEANILKIQGSDHFPLQAKVSA